MMVDAFVMSCLDYRNGLYCGVPKREIDKVQCVQSCAARLVSGIRRSDHVTPVMTDSACVEFKILLLTFRILMIELLTILSSLLVKYQRAHLLRSSKRLLLQVPSVYTMTYGHCSF